MKQNPFVKIIAIKIDNHIKQRIKIRDNINTDTKIKDCVSQLIRTQ